MSDIVERRAPLKKTYILFSAPVATKEATLQADTEQPRYASDVSNVFLSYSDHKWSKAEMERLTRHLDAWRDEAWTTTPVQDAHLICLAVSEEMQHCPLEREQEMAERAQMAQHQLLATRAKSRADMRLKVEMFEQSYGEDPITCVLNGEAEHATLDLFVSLLRDLQTTEDT